MMRLGPFSVSKRMLGVAVGWFLGLAFVICTLAIT